MRRKLGDLIWGQSTNGNSVGQILAQLKRDIALLRSRPVKVAALEEISPDLGTITAGRFIASSDSDPLTIIDSDTEGNAPTVAGSGVAIDGDGIPVENGGDKGNIIGYNSATPTVYVSATNGKLYAGEGAVELSEDGYRLINVDDVSRFLFNDPFIVNNSGDIGSISQFNGDTLSIEFDPYGNDELLLNPGFEAGALTNWTAAGAGTWSAQTTTVYHGLYAARCLISGTSAHTLTSDRIVMSQSDLALLVVYQYDTLFWTEKTAYINWYDAAAGGNLLQTDSVDLGNAGAGTWRYKILRAAGHGSAASCEVVLSATASSGTPSIYFDAIRLRQQGGVGAIQIRGTIKGAIPQGAYGVAAPPSYALGKAVLPYWVDGYGGPHVLRYGDYEGYKTRASSTSEIEIYSRLIGGGGMGDYGTMRYVASGLQINTSASNRTFRHRIYLGATTLFDFTNTVTTAQDYRPFDIVLNITNKGAPNVQGCRGYVIEGANSGGDSSGLGSAPNINFLLNSAAVDTTAMQAFRHTITMDGSASTVSWQLVSAYVDGPNPTWS